MVLSPRFVLVPFNFQTAMCKFLSPFFNILTLNSSSVHGFCGKPVNDFRLQFPRTHPPIFAMRSQLIMTVFRFLAGSDYG